MTDLPYAISDIHIRNFRGIEDLKLSFCGPDGKTPNRLVVIGGPNGCGKTTVLEAVLLAAGYRKGIRGEHDSKGFWVWRHSFEIDASFIEKGDVILRRCVGAGDATIGVPCVYFSSWRTSEWVGPLSISGQATRKQTHERERLAIVKQHLVNATAYDLFPSNDQQATSGISQTLEQLNETWGVFFPGENFRVERSGDVTVPAFDVYVYGRNGHRITVDELSSGQLEIFMFAARLLVWKFDEGIILIDEPELHLDQQWHRYIVDAIQKLKPNCQLIVATHSPEIYHSATSFERHFLIPDDDIRAKVWRNMVETAAQEH